jgi:crotonobetaine/carnitine-CoA ligase
MATIVPDPDFMPFGRLLAAKAHEDPDREFLLFDENRYTLGDLDAWSNRIAHGFQALGFGPGKHVSVMLPNSPRWLAVFFALQKIGAGVVPINVALRGQSLGYILDHSDSEALVLDPEFTAAFEEVGEKCSKIRHVIYDTTVRPDLQVPAGAITLEDLASGARRPVEATIDPDAIGTLMYTSGTTGLPKGVVIRYGAGDARRTEPLAMMFYKPEDVLYTPLPLFHANALFISTMCALQSGARLGLGRRFSASRFWDEARHYGATSFNALGAMIPILMKQPERPDDADNPVKWVMSAACPANVWEAFERRFDVKIYEFYGAVDSGGFLTFNIGNAPIGSIGQAPPGVVMKVADPNGNEVPVGQPGELLFQIDDADLRKVDYYKDEKASNKKIRDGWLHTGDIVYRDEEGNLYFVDRLTDSMRRRGENVSSYEVEREVNAHPAVLESAAYGVPSELGEDDIMVAVVLKPGERLEPEDLIAFLRERVAKFMVPRYVDFREELPKTETHRIQKTELKRQGVTPTTWDGERAEASARKP